MGSLADDLAADYAEAIGGYEQTFDWNGHTLPCVRTTAAAALEAYPGGDEGNISDKITVALSDLPDGETPAAGDFIDDGSLQITSTDPNVGHLVLWCTPSMNMGAGHEE